MEMRFNRGPSGNVVGPGVFQIDGPPIPKPAWRMLLQSAQRLSEPVMIPQIRLKVDDEF